jgi:hypothetical protein
MLHPKSEPNMGGKLNLVWVKPSQGQSGPPGSLVIPQVQRVQHNIHH